MKETPVSQCEKSFLLEALWEGKRLDGRGLMDSRDVDITFGLDWGSCQVTLGRSRVLAQVSAQVGEPNITRPNEGVLRVNVELTPLAAPKFESGRITEDCVEINRLLERCLMESKCLDLESLCIVSEEKVWEIRLDLHVLNHEGNLFDTCSIAGLAALCHFRRPDVTLKGDVVTVHPITERDPVPLAVHHHPVTTTFAIFHYPSSGESLTVCDPSRLEEDTMQGKMVLGVNAYREICTLHLAGQILVDKKLVLRLANTAAEKAKRVVERIKAALAAHEEAIKNRTGRGFAAKNRANVLLSRAAVPRAPLDLTGLSGQARRTVQEQRPVAPVPAAVVASSKKADENESGIAEIVPESVMVIDSDSESEDSDLEVTAVKSREEVLKEKVTEKIELEDSEEEETVTMTAIEK